MQSKIHLMLLKQYFTENLYVKGFQHKYLFEVQLYQNNWEIIFPNEVLKGTKIVFQQGIESMSKLKPPAQHW